MALTEPQIRRYSRHILLPDVGGTGQARLLAATVVVDLDVWEPDAPDAPDELAALIAAATYLAAAGIGTLVLLGAGRIVREADIRASLALDASHVATWPVPPDPAAVAEMRKAACRQLSEWGLDEAAFVTGSALMIDGLPLRSPRFCCAAGAPAAGAAAAGCC